MPGATIDRSEIERLVRGEHHEPHRVLGAHPYDGKLVIRAWRPEATAVTALVDGARFELDRVHPAGLFEGSLEHSQVPAYQLEVRYGSGTFTLDDPYRFLPTVGEMDLYLFGEGKHERLWHKLGAHELTVEGVAGTAFAVWAPTARSVRVVGDFNRWDGRLHPMRSLGASGVWELFVPGAGEGIHYKFELVTAVGELVLKADTMAFATEALPATASVVTTPKHRWGDQEWMAGRAARQSNSAHISIY